MTTTTSTTTAPRFTCVSAKDAARMLRAELKKTWPGVRFSVVRDRSNPCAGSVSWVDGPTRAQVAVIARQYEITADHGSQHGRTSNPGRLITDQGQTFLAVFPLQPLQLNRAQSLDALRAAAAMLDAVQPGAGVVPEDWSDPWAMPVCDRPTAETLHALHLPEQYGTTGTVRALINRTDFTTGERLPWWFADRYTAALPAGVMIHSTGYRCGCSWTTTEDAGADAVPGACPSHGDERDPRGDAYGPLRGDRLPGVGHMHRDDLRRFCDELMRAQRNA